MSRHRAITSPELRERKARGPSPEKTAQTCRAIIDAALSEFMDVGFARATMANVARRANVAKGTPYLYFETKEKLFEGVVQQIISKALIAIETEALAPGETVESFLRRTLLPAMRTLEQSGRAAVAQLVLTEGGRFPALVESYRREVYEPLLAQITRLAGIAVQTGELPTDALVRFPELLISPLWLGMINNQLLRPDRQIDLGEMFETYLTLVFRER